MVSTLPAAASNTFWSMSQSATSSTLGWPVISLMWSLRRPRWLRKSFVCPWVSLSLFERYFITSQWWGMLSPANARFAGVTSKLVHLHPERRAFYRRGGGEPGAGVDLGHGPYAGGRGASAVESRSMGLEERFEAGPVAEG